MTQHFHFFNENLDFVKIYQELDENFDKQSISLKLDKLKSDFRNHLKNSIEN